MMQHVAQQRKKIVLCNGRIFGVTLCDSILSRVTPFRFIGNVQWIALLAKLTAHAPRKSHKL